MFNTIDLEKCSVLLTMLAWRMASISCVLKNKSHFIQLTRFTNNFIITQSSPKITILTFNRMGFGVSQLDFLIDHSHL